MGSPKVSVIIPVYKSEPYIERCARSLFEQTLDDLEFIFIDDCSPDRSTLILQNILQEYPNRFTQTRIIRNETNLGQSMSRRKGIGLAKSKYLTFCDSDDWVAKDIYKQLYMAATVNCADLVYCNFYLATDTSLKLMNNLSNNLIIDIINSKVSASLWDKLFSRKLFDNDLKYTRTNMGEDMILSLQLITRATKIAYVESPLYYYYHNQDSTSVARNTDAVIKRFQGMMESTNMLSEILNMDLTPEYSKANKYRKFITKLTLFPIIDNNKWYRIFKETYPEITLRWVLAAKVPLCKKIIYILMCLRISPVAYKLKDAISN